jgi:DNA-binding MarR family transcriptional regulator
MTRWLTPQERAAWVGLAALLERLPAVLETQLRRDSDLSHFEYWVLAMLSESPERTLRMSQVASLTSATLPRLSHVVSRLEGRGLVARSTCPTDARATNLSLTPAGWAKVVDAAPGHVENVRDNVIDALSPEQVRQLEEISWSILDRIAPEWIDAVRATARPGQAEPVA